MAARQVPCPNLLGGEHSRSNGPILCGSIVTSGHDAAMAMCAQSRYIFREGPHMLFIAATFTELPVNRGQ